LDWSLSAFTAAAPKSPIIFIWEPARIWVIIKLTPLDIPFMDEGGINRLIGYSISLEDEIPLF
jgi:hypothetical protein